MSERRCDHCGHESHLGIVCGGVLVDGFCACGYLPTARVEPCYHYRHDVCVSTACGGVLTDGVIWTCAEHAGVCRDHCDPVPFCGPCFRTVMRALDTLIDLLDKLDYGDDGHVIAAPAFADVAPYWSEDRRKREGLAAEQPEGVVWPVEAGP